MRVLLIAVTALCLSIFGPAKAAEVGLPDLASGVVTLRVVHAVNPRLNKISDVEVQTLLTQTSRTVKTYFGIDLKFERQPDTTVEAILAKVPPGAFAARRGEIYDFKTDTGDPARIVTALTKQMIKYRISFDDALDYAGLYLVAKPADKTLAGMAQAIATTHLKRLEHWKNLKTASGQSVIDQSHANEFIVWDLAGYGDLPYDLIVTNQLVASAEYADADISASLRGGVSTGATSYSKSGRFKAYAFISTFPFVEPGSIPKALGGVTDRAQAVRLAGQYAAHEIGHLLLHLGHPYANPACVMRSAQVLDYIAWARDLDPAKCKLGSSKAMTPGAAKIEYRPDW